MWVTALITIAVVYLCLSVLLCGCQRAFMYFPDPHLPLPASVGLPGAEVVTLRTEDGLDLVAWLLRSDDRPYTVVVFHGNAGNISHRGHVADAIWRAGCSVLLVEYRGYGGNPGSPTEEGLYRDARAAARFLGSRDDIDPSRLIYFGKSLGSGPATQLAVEHPPAALILDSPYTSMSAVAGDHYWYLPTRWLVWDKYDNLTRIGQIKSPLLILCGTRDRIIAPKHAKRLYDAANEPKRLVEIPGAGHNDMVLTGGSRYVEAIREMVRAADKGR